MDADIEDTLSFLRKSDTIAGNTDQIEEKQIDQFLFLLINQHLFSVTH